MFAEKSFKHQKIVDEFGKNLICNWLSRSGFVVSIVDHTGIDIIAFNPKTKRRMGISIRSRIRSLEKEQTRVNLFDHNGKVKIKESCEYYACDPWIAIYVETTSNADVFLTSLENYESNYYRGTKFADWKMRIEDIQKYDKDESIKHLHILFEPRNWFMLSLDKRMKLKIYSDGASRGNPGNSALAFMLVGENGKLLRSHSKYIGIKTNNQAEYMALISALESASLITSGEVTCRTDSELIVRQLKGIYEIRDTELRKLSWKIKELKKKFQKVTFIHVPREDIYIQEVDKIVNKVLS